MLNFSTNRNWIIFKNKQTIGLELRGNILTPRVKRFQDSEQQKVSVVMDRAGRGFVIVFDAIL